jgi:hypothetical protein
MQMEAWTLLDRGSRLYALLHEARVRRELSYDPLKMMKYISMVVTMKDNMCSIQEVFLEEKP